MKIEIDAFDYISSKFTDKDINTLILKLFQDRDEPQLYLMEKMYEIMDDIDKEDFLEFARKYSKDSIRVNKYFDYGNCREIPAIEKDN